MNKYLLMSAAAVLAGSASTAANAAVSFHFLSAGGGSYCDGGKLTDSASPVYAWTHNFTHACGFSHNTFGQGLLGKTSGVKEAEMSDTYSASRVLSYVLPKKAKTGGAWSLYVTSNGVTSTLANSGTIGAGLAKHQPGAAKTTFSAVKDIISKR